MTSLTCPPVDYITFFPFLLYFALPLVLFQVRGGQQGLFSCSADARRPGKGLGHVGRLPRKHLCKGPPTPLRSLSHYLLPPCLSPSEREQVPQISSQGEDERAQGTHAFLRVMPTMLRIKNDSFLSFALTKSVTSVGFQACQLPIHVFFFLMFDRIVIMCWMGMIQHIVIGAVRGKNSLFPC